MSVVGTRRNAKWQGAVGERRRPGWDADLHANVPQVSRPRCSGQPERHLGPRSRTNNKSPQKVPKQRLLRKLEWDMFILAHLLCLLSSITMWRFQVSRFQSSRAGVLHLHSVGWVFMLCGTTSLRPDQCDRLSNRETSFLAASSLNLED